ncbi:MAG: serine/threonine-protein kinase [Pseudomonadota bacterium]
MSGYCAHCRAAKDAVTACPDCSGALIPLERDGDALVLAGKYELVGHLGSGAQGVVLRFRHRVTGRTWAVKYLFHDVSEDDEAHFLEEVRCLGELNSPAVVGIADCDRDPGGLLYYIMEDFSGGSLSDRLQAGPLDAEEFFRLFAQVTRGLAAVHSVGIVHRDVKPGNILLSGDREAPRAALSDFGVSRRGASAGGRLAGTPPYMAPQQFLGEDTPANDVYSLGIVMWECLAGRALYQCASLEEYERCHNTREPDLGIVRDLGPLGPELKGLLSRCLQKDSATRYPDGAALDADLQRLSVRFFERRQRTLARRGLGRVGVALSYPAFLMSGVAFLPVVTDKAAGREGPFVGIGLGVLATGFVLRYLGKR